MEWTFLKDILKVSFRLEEWFTGRFFFFKLQNCNFEKDPIITPDVSDLVPHSRLGSLNFVFLVALLTIHISFTFYTNLGRSTVDRRNCRWVCFKYWSWLSWYSHYFYTLYKENIIKTNFQGKCEVIQEKVWKSKI